MFESSNDGGRPKMNQQKWTYFEGKLGIRVLPFPNTEPYGDKQRGIGQEICNLYQNFQ